MSASLFRSPCPLALVWLFAIAPMFSAYGQPSSVDGQQLIVEARRAYDERRFVEAEVLFKQAVQALPKSFDARHGLAMALYEQGHNEEAVKRFNEAIRLNRKAPETYIGLGRAYMRIKNRMIEAREAFQEALKQDSSYADAHYHLGISSMEIARRDLAAVLYVIQARKAFQDAIRTHPGHPDAYYRLALSYEDPSTDFETAMSIFYRQLTVKPDHEEALAHFGRTCFLAGRYQEGADLLRQLADLHGDRMPVLARTLIAQFEASYLQTQRQYDEAEKVYETFIASLPPREQALYRDLGLVASQEEALAYQAATEEEKKRLWYRFWASRDPDPATVVNERLVEHYRRVTQARERFSRGQFPWDRRGELYIRYGDPDDLQHFVMRSGEKSIANYQPTGNPRIDAIRERNYLLRYRLKVDNAGAAWGTELKREILDPATDDRTLAQSARLDNTQEVFLLIAGEETQGLAFVAESWVYVKHDLELFFVDQLGMGKFDYPLGVHDTNIDEAGLQDRFHPQRMAELLIKRTPEAHVFDYEGEPLDFLYDLVTYRSANGDSADVEISYVVPTRQLGSVEDGQGLKTWFESHIVLRDDDFRRVANGFRKIGPIARPLRKMPKKKFGVDLHTAGFTVKSPPGSYRSAVEVRDTASKRVGIFEQPYTVPDYRGDSLMVSDIKLAVSIQPSETPGPFDRNGLAIEPNPARLFLQSEPIYFYYEIYNLKSASDGKTSYKTELEISVRERSRNIVWRLLAGLGKLITRSDGDQSVLMVFEDEGKRADEFRYTAIDAGESTTGPYVVTIRVTDLHSGQTSEKTKEFVITSDRGQVFDKDAPPLQIDVKLLDGTSPR
ncbi:MAG: tetratricopeptide repeat protein [candidate division Zixibacteria bacterium]|nr:tetratricopeptide repeat protein [candidate division Zixibacteria bacterium]